MTEKIMTLLLGSPRVGGNSETVADAIASGAAEKGYEIRKVRLSALSLKGCMDCRKCWSSGAPCIQKDDMGKVHRDIEDSSVLVFVSPLYYYSWSSQIKPVWDRLLPYGMPNSERSLEGKGAILAATAGDEEDGLFDGMIASFDKSSQYLKWKILGHICVSGVYGKGEILTKGQKYLEEARALGRSL